MISKKKSSSIVQFTTIILKFGKKGEKTGWTYIEIPADVASQLAPGIKKSFRIKGLLDNFPISSVAILPMGKGVFILPINATMRKGIGKRHGAMLNVKLQADSREVFINKELMKCLKDDPDALLYFNELTKSHQHYFSKWIDGAKTRETKANRIARTLKALSRKMNYGEMLRERI